MQVTETLSDGLRRAYSVVVSAADIESKCRTKLAEISRTIRLPGFRPGKVPVNLVRKRYGASVMAEVMQDSVNNAADRVIEERGLRPAGQPKIALEREPKIDAGQAADLAFSVEFEVLPEIVAPDLAAISLVRLKAVVDDAKIEETLANVAKGQREMMAIEDRGAEPGDILTVDYDGSVDGVPFEGGAGQDTKVEVGGAGFVPGFSDGMIGMKPGEARDIEVTFPADYHGVAVAGKAAVFKITAKSLVIPSEALLDDTMASRLGFESLQKLRELLAGQMQRELDGMSRLRIKRELLDVLADKAGFPAPQNLVEAEFAAIWQRVEQDMKSGEVDEDDRGKDPETLKAEYRAIADRRVRLGLLLSEIGRAAKIEVSSAELNQALRQEASRYPGQEVQVVKYFRETPQAIEQLRGPLFEDKVVDYILEMAQVEDRIVAAEELTMPPADDAGGVPKLGFTPEPEAVAAAGREAGAEMAEPPATEAEPPAGVEDKSEEEAA